MNGKRNSVVPAKPKRTPAMLFVVPSALAGPLLYFLLPRMTRVDLSWWLADHRLSGAGFTVMVFYFGLVHPLLEQIHWAPLRESAPLGHFAFAGYHMLVLYSLMKVPWLAACFVVLAAASPGFCPGGPSRTGGAKSLVWNTSLRNEQADKNAADRLRNALYDIGRSRGVRAGASDHSIPSPRRRLLRAKLGTVLSPAIDRSPVGRVYQQLPGRQGHTA